MNKRRNTFTCSVAVVAGLVGIISFCNAAHAVEVPASEAGVMRIVMQHPGKAEMPAAVFDHEAHAAKVEKDGGDCAVCHTALGKDVKGMKPFSVVKNYKGKDSLMNAWHKTCFECHEKYDKAPEAASCRSCHDAEAAAEKRVPVNFDIALHAAHVNSKHVAPVVPAGEDAANVKNCGACHVSVDANGKTYYAPDTEDAYSFFRTDSATAANLPPSPTTPACPAISTL